MQTSDFLGLLGHDRITVQTFGDKTPTRELCRVMHAPYKVIHSRLEALNYKGAGIFFTVNKTDLRGRKAENITGVTAYFADLDGAPYYGAPLEPTVMVESSAGKYHLYWRVSDAPLSSFSHVQNHVATLLGGDTKVKDLPRVMRLPNFYHNKAEPFLVRVIESTGVIYSHAEFVEAFAVPPEPVKISTPSIDAYLGKKRSSRDAGKGDIGGNLYRILNAREGNRNHTLFRQASAVVNNITAGDVKQDEAFTQLLEAAQAVGLSEVEARRTIESAFKYVN